MLRPANQASVNRRGCYIFGFSAMAILLLIVALGLGLLGDLDLGKISWVPTT
jgi:hypothetical protein